MQLGPPPRRVIPTRLFWVVLAGIFSLGSVVHLGIYASETSHPLDLEALSRLGQRTEGRVEKIWTEDKGAGRSVEASYEAQGKSFRSWNRVTLNEAAELVKGGPVSVIYLPSAPNQALVGSSINHAIHARRESMLNALALAAGVTGFGAMFITVLYRIERRWLQKEPAFPGKIVAHEVGGALKNRFLSYTYEWTSDRLRRDVWSVYEARQFILLEETEVTVLQDQYGESLLFEAMIWARPSMKNPAEVGNDALLPMK